MPNKYKASSLQLGTGLFGDGVTGPLCSLMNSHYHFPGYNEQEYCKTYYFLRDSITHVETQDYLK